MRRFLDWTSAQTTGAAGGQPVSNNNNINNNNNNGSNNNNSGNSRTSLQQPSHPAQAGSSSMVPQQQQQQQSGTHSTRDLEIQHLTKLLHEIKYYQASSSPLPSAAGSQTQREFVEKVHKTLPLFLNVFGTSSLATTTPTPTSMASSSILTGTNLPAMSTAGYHESSIDLLDSSYPHSESSSKPNSPLPSPQMDRFPDLLPFAFTIARLFVSEVRQRASNKHAEDASLAILQFLNVPHRPTPPAQQQQQQQDIQPERNGQHDTVSTIPKTTTVVDETIQGWNLLLSLNTMALSQSSQIIQLLCDASLPSTLIKCLYLFFDLPAASTVNKISTTKSSSSSAASTDKEVEETLAHHQARGIVEQTSLLARDITAGPLIKAFTQLLVQLCSNQAAIDELIKKDDLRLLIGISSSQCSRHSRPWRKVAFQTLLAISKNMRANFIYLETNNCIQIYVENMHRINSLSLAGTDEFVEMIKTLLEFLYNLDANNRNQPRCIAPLIEQFKASRIIDLIEELIFKIDDTITQEVNQTLASPTSGGPADTEQHRYAPVSQQPSVSSELGQCVDEYRRYAKRIMQSVTVMAKINLSQDAMGTITTLKPLAMNRFEMFEFFKMPRPSARNCILNYDALQVLKMAWSKCQDSHVIETILDATISLFNDDKYNYFIFESQQLLVYYMTSYNFKLFPYKVKQKLFKFLEFIIIETNYIPCLELGTLGTIIKHKVSSDADLILGLRTLIACLRFNSKFSDIFREIGLLEVIVELLIKTMQEDKLRHNADKQEVLYLLLEASQYMLAGPNNLNCIQFNESGAARHVFNCLSKPEFFHLFVPAHSSSSDDGGGGGGPTPRARTPPMSAHLFSRSQTQQHHQYWSESSHYKPSIKQLQKVAFTIIRQLILSTAGDEHLANLLGLLARNLDDLKCYEETVGQQSDFRLDQASDACETTQQSHQAKTINFTFLISQEVNLKICILKSLMIILKDSHRCRTLFKKAGGFIYIVSSLVTLENSLLSCEPLTDEREIESYERWRKVNSRRIWRLIKNSLITIVVAIRFEPANLRAFSDEVLSKFTEAIRRLGCFKPNQKDLPAEVNQSGGKLFDKFDSYRSIFLAPQNRDYSTIANENIKPNEACCQLFRFLYDMSLDMGDGTGELEVQLDRHNHNHQRHQVSHDATKSISFDQGSSSSSPSVNNRSISNESGIFKRRSQLNMAPKRPPSLDLNTKNTDSAILTFPCIIMSILDLIPSCPSEDLMAFICTVVTSLFKHERNQQMLCEAGMISKLLNLSWRISITSKNHFLHESSIYMLERLTKQSITAKELRMFLRLDLPLKCTNLDDIEVTESFDETRQKFIESSAKEALLSLSEQESTTPPVPKEKIPTDRIEAFVAMMSDDRTKIQPPFVEFDMSNNGFNSIFMPSIAPINAKLLPPNANSFLNSTLDIHTNEKNGILGGVGSTERQFPPNTGLTFSTWVCIESFPSRSSDSNHNIRLLTIYRGSAATGKEFSCFKVQISALDRALTVSTQEALLFDTDNRSESQIDPDCNLRIWTPELLLEGKWHHIAITVTRSTVKQSVIHVYVDGVSVHHQRICYISSYVGTTNSGPLGGIVSPNNGNTSAAAYVNAFIGSLPPSRYKLRTHWKQGPCHLIEEPLSSNFIGVIFALGPNFIGNFQSSTKLVEIAKIKGSQQAHYDVKYHQSVAQNQHSGQHHKPLVHQQSAAVVGSSHHAHSNALMRVSSSNIGSSSASGGKVSSSSPLSSSHSQYNLPEERILVGIDARATSLMTLSRMRRIYTRFDCRQVSRVLGLSLHENSTPILIMHNTGVHLNGSSRGVGAITIGYNQVRCFVPGPTQHTLFSIGGSHLLLGLVAQANTTDSFTISMRSLVLALKYNTNLQAQMDNINGYQILSVFFWKKKHLLNEDILKLTFALITETKRIHVHDHERMILGVQQVGALRDLICECFDLWLQTDLINLVLEFIYDIISSNVGQEQQSNNIGSTGGLPSLPSSTRIKNLKSLRDMDLLPRMLRLLPQYDAQQVGASLKESGGIKNLLESGGINVDNNQCVSGSPKTFDAKAVYLIKQTVFELLNRTPRQSDILYFGQFLASLLPSKDKERSVQTINLRNILLKSLLQMMTKNKQTEVNHAMQEELVRILGFDWFMLFISSPNLDHETIDIGFLNLMIILSNEDLYQSFKLGSTSNGGWLKEPTFPTIDGKFNIQVLGINVGVFFGLKAKRQSIKQEILEAPNFFLLSNSLTNLINLPRVYLMIFQTMMSHLTKLDSTVLDTIEAFNELNLDILCDCLVGETHHKRRQTLANIQFRCHELIVCLVYMLRDILWQYERQCNQPQQQVDKSSSRAKDNYPVDVTRFLMYLYNNNREFQNYCRKSDALIDALCESLMKPEDCSELLYTSAFTFSSSSSPADDDRAKNPTKITSAKLMTCHPASKEVLELSRLIILDTMTDTTSQSTYPDQASGCNWEQLHTFERFFESLSACKDAQGELVDMLLRQVLLMIDSTARHNSIKTIGSSENIMQFQLLLINSITVSQIVVDKIWLQELYADNYGRVLTIIDHQLCLAEQIFKFNELLPKHNPPHAFVMQRVLNRILLFALSKPMQHISDKMLMLDLLRKIHDNRTIIILNHMHSPHSAEFFVCFAYCLLRIIEDNSVLPASHSTSSHSTDNQPSSLIERHYGHPSNLGGSSGMRSMMSEANLNEPSSSALMLVSQARKVWDAIYQSKKGILSEALDVSLSLPAFTLDTSLDLLQLKPDIEESCERCWASFLEAERKPKRRIQQRQTEPASASGAASSAVNLLSGRLTRVVNAANFVSRVVGATAGTMASNVNLVGEKFTQQSRAAVSSHQRPSRTSISDQSGVAGGPFNGGQPTATNLLANQVSSSTTSGHQQPGNQSNSSSDHTELFKCSNLSRSQIDEASRTHISIIEDYIESQLSQKNHKLALHKYLCDEWLDTEYEVLLRERALFGPDFGSKLDKWCLDLTEGPRRMRKKMLNNTSQFYEHYPYRPEQYNPSNKSLRYRPPMSYDSHMYYMKTTDLDDHLLDLNDQLPVITTGKPTTLVSGSVDGELTQQAKATDCPSPQVVAGEITEADDQNENNQVKIELDSTEAQQNQRALSSPSPILKSINAHDCSSSIESLASNRLVIGDGAKTNSPKLSESGDRDDDGDSTSFVDFSPEIEAETNLARESAENIDSLSVLRLLEKNERISYMFRCSRVQGLDTYEGLLLFGREHFYLIDGFTLLKTREIKDIDSLPPDAHDPIIPNSTPNILACSKKTCSKFSFDSVVEVHKRRYLLQPIALEVFSSDGRNTLIVFPRNIRNKVYSRLMTVSTHLTNNAHESLAGQKSNVSIEGGSGLLSNLIGETSVTQRWVRGELSNFQYLMNLNTIAGRSYNDLMQYPIFPWILADYTSNYLDLSKPSTFRDLSRPIGAQTSDRLEQFKRRYAEWDDTETPPYHYGTFYSSAMIVASYMVRMEPFTQHFLRLQGGHFDLADRMFHSIHDSWLSASKHNMADIKELIPEFFYLPEFLKNENKYDLGIKQNGMKLNNVILPPWAKNDTREFIRLHRCALESDYVSAHLHEWIDLIFGYKQQGQPAVEAVNVFHHLFYEGNVDIYNTDIDPIKKNAVIGFINNFGQVPKQLFKKAHPARKVTSSGYSNSAAASIPLAPILPSLSPGSGAYSNQRILTHCPQALKQASTTFKDLRGPVGQIVQIDKNIVAVEQNKLLIPPEYCRYIAWGHADRSLRLGLYDSEKPIFVWEGSDNMAPSEILCCTIPNSRTMITAGTESLITVWKIERMRSFTPVMNLYGHVEPITCLASSQSYSIIVSGSRDRTAIIWDLNRFTFVRQLGGGPSEKLVHHGPISAITINDSTGDIATCASSWLYLWTINGELLASIDSLGVIIQKSLSEGNASGIGANSGQLHILSVCFSQNNEWDLDEVIVTGSSDGSVAIWSMRYYQSPLTKAEIEEIHMKKEEEEEAINREEYRDASDMPALSSLPEVTKEPSTEQHDFSVRESAQASEPINIQMRKRTDTMNSEWVRLSASSTSTIDTIPVLRTSSVSKSLSEQAGEIAESGDNFCDGSSLYFPSDSQSLTPGKLSVDDAQLPIASSPVEPSQTESSINTLTASHGGLLDGGGSSTGNLSQSNCDDLDGQSNSMANLFLAPNDPSMIKFSKSDTSLIDSFVILGDAPNSSSQHPDQSVGKYATTDRMRPQSSAGSSHPSTSGPASHRGRKKLADHRADNHDRPGPKSASKLLPNHCWRRELYLRTLLPRRNGKMPPMAVTSLAIAKDHKTVFVGDASGRIVSWTTC